MHWKAMFKGEFIAAVEFGDKQPTLTIASVKLCKLESEDGRQKDKGVVFFEGKDRGWVMNRTNATCLAAMFGDDTASWNGKRVTLYATLVQVGKKKEPRIRVKGSPDLPKPVPVEIKLPRKKPYTVTMQPTGAKPNGAAKPAPEPEPAPEEPSDEEMAAASVLADAQGGEPISF
jgi:hypothetical protein